ncbi:hypothetical protein EMMF5_003611 [Cystobasidiomycetes sp. EMM_F5]
MSQQRSNITQSAGTSPTMQVYELAASAAAINSLADDADVVMTVTVPASVARAALSHAAATADNPSKGVASSGIYASAASTTRAAAAASSTTRLSTTGVAASTNAYGILASSDSIGIMSLSTLAVKPIIGSTPIVFGATATGSSPASSTAVVTNSPGNSDSNFSHVSSSPAAIALISIGSVALAAVVVAGVAFFLRRSSRRKARQARYAASYPYVGPPGWYSDSNGHRSEGSPPSTSSSMRQLTLPMARANRELREKDAYSHQQVSFPVQTFMHTVIPASDDGSAEGSLYDEPIDAGGRRKSSMDRSLVHHITSKASVMHTPSLYQADSPNQYGLARAWDQPPPDTAASSPFLDSHMTGPLRSANLGSFSASAAPRTFSEKAAASPSISSLAPARPARPPSLSSSFKHAIDEDLASRSPFIPPTKRSPLNSARPDSLQDTSVTTPLVTSQWGHHTISQVFGTTALSPKSADYDEEEADVFMALPNLPPRKSSSRWASFSSEPRQHGSMSSLQQPDLSNMPSRFSVTTLGSVDSDPGHADWQVRVAQRQMVMMPPRAPFISANTQSPAAQSDVDTLGEPKPMFSYFPQPADSPFADPTEWQDTAPLNTYGATMRRQSEIARASTIQSDFEKDGEQTNSVVRELIRKRSTAGLFAEGADLPY